LSWGYIAVQQDAGADEPTFCVALAREAVAELRVDLAEADAPDERLEILAELADAAMTLQAEGDEAADLAGECASEAIAGFARIRPEFAAASDEGLVALYLLAEVCRLRDEGSDLDDAISHLEGLRRLLPPEDPGHLDVELELGQALLERCRRLGRPADLDQVLASLTDALGHMDPDDARRLVVLATLAFQHAARYIGYNGSQDDRHAALYYAAQVLAAPDVTADTAAGCHVITAWMTVYRQADSAYRSTWLNRAQIEGARRGGPEAAELRSLITNVPLAVDDAEIALSHLRQADAADLNEDVRDMATSLLCLVTLKLLAQGRFPDDITELASRMEEMAARQPLDDPGRGELLSVRATLLAAQARRDASARGSASPGGQAADPGLEPTAAEALRDAAVQLPRNHLMRPAVLDLIRQSFSRQTEAAGVTDDVAAEVDRLVGSLEQMPQDDPEFARALARIAANVMGLNLSRRGAVPLARLSEQMERAVAQLALDDPLRSLGEYVRWSAVGVQGATEHRPDLVQQAIDGFRECAGGLPEGHSFRSFVLAGVAAAHAELWIMTGEMRQLEQGLRNLREAGLDEAVGSSAPLPEGRAMLLYLRGMLELMKLMDEREASDLSTAISDLEQARDLIASDHPLHARLMVDVQSVRMIQEHLKLPSTGPLPAFGREPRAAVDGLLAAVGSLRHDHPDFPGLSGQAAVGLMLQGLADRDVTAIGQAITLFADACAVPGLTFRERPRVLNSLGFALLTRYNLTRQPQDLSNAIDRLEEARRAVEQETASPYAATVFRSLAEAYRIRADVARGDVDRAVSAGLAALREHAGDVLLQDTDEHALKAARSMITDADEMARWSLAHGREHEAIAALELGRGTVLYAATAGAGLADILRDGGFGDLADEWSRDPATSQGPDTESSSDLRYRIMTTIEGSAAEARLLAPPPLEDIAAAVRRHDLDALVYLLPRDGASPGLAVIVGPSGAITSVPLPGLHLQAGGPSRDYIKALQAVSGGSDQEIPAAATASWRTALDEVCDWAWPTVVRPLLAAVPRRVGKTRRIVLVPTSELGLVPWHAARERTGNAYRYASQEVIFSYAASARQFIDTAGLEFRPWGQRPVLISDASSSSFATWIAICQLQRSIYPNAAVYGYAFDNLAALGATVADGGTAATPEDVIEAVPHEASSGASVLHFGGHGQVGIPVLNSTILLDDRCEPGRPPSGRVEKPERRTLAVAQILRRARTRLPSDHGGLVVLASCLTDVTGADHDEALTLATAFLSAGAAGAVAARWRVESAQTACFMLTFHQFLNTSEPEPAAALRATQLWMLDPDRCVPDDWPSLIKTQAAKPGLASPMAWAGFSYQGR
jgi:hypothetical protein